MSRDSPANTEYIYKTLGTLKSVFEHLPDSNAYTSLFDKYEEHLLNQRAAVYHATELLPILAAIVVIQVERDLDHAHEMTKMRNQLIQQAQEINTLREEMEQLRREIKRLPSHD